MGIARIREKDQKDSKGRSGHRRGAPQDGRTRMNGKSSTLHPHRGSTLDEFLDNEGIRGKIESVAIKEVIAWQVAQAMKRQKLSKVALAERMGTSRAQLDRLLDPRRDVTLSTLSRAAAALGQRLQLTFG